MLCVSCPLHQLFLRLMIHLFFPPDLKVQIFIFSLNNSIAWIINIITNSSIEIAKRMSTPLSTCRAYDVWATLVTRIVTFPWLGSPRRKQKPQVETRGVIKPYPMKAAKIWVVLLFYTIPHIHRFIFLTFDNLLESAGKWLNVFKLMTGKS